MKVKKILFVVVVTLAGIHSQATSAHAQVKYFQEEKSLERNIREFLLSKHVSGNVAVVWKNRLVFNEGIGFANRKNPKANLSSTTHPIGSITKAMVAVSIMQLQEKGELSVNDTLSKFFSQSPNNRKIKLLHLLNHTSGIQVPLLLQRNMKPREIVEAALKTPIKFSAGEKWDYNDINYLILGTIVEKASKQPLHQYIQKHIFDQARMHHSGFITKTNQTPYSSTGYIRIGSRLLPAKNLNIPMLYGCGDIFSTAQDLCLFDEALMSGKLVSNETLKQMLSPGAKSKYGMGLYINENRVYSRGVLNGWEALHVYYKDKTAIAILLNVRDKRINIHQLSRDIYRMVQG